MKTALISGLFLLSSFFAFSQYDMEKVKNDTLNDEPSLWSKIQPRIYVGGEGSFSAGFGRTYLYLAPLVGYDITDQLSVGISGMYQLLRFQTNTGAINFNSYGGGTFFRFRPIKQVVFQAEFDYFNTVDFAGQTFDRVNVPAFMVGAGYLNPLGSRAYYQIMLMWDFINDPNMPVPSLIFQPLHLKLGLVWYIGY